VGHPGAPTWRWGDSMRPSPRAVLHVGSTERSVARPQGHCIHGERSSKIFFALESQKDHSTDSAIKVDGAFLGHHSLLHRLVASHSLFVSLERGTESLLPLPDETLSQVRQHSPPEEEGTLSHAQG
jgi:hypothetical protein